MPDDCANFSHSVLIWAASSRVGASATATGPSPRFTWSLTVFRMSINAGKRKPHVLPDPVLATAMRSRPSMASGQHWDWIAEGCAKPCDLIAATSSSLNPASSKRWIGGGHAAPAADTRISCSLSHASGETIALSEDTSCPSAFFPFLPFFSVRLSNVSSSSSEDSLALRFLSFLTFFSSASSASFATRFRSFLALLRAALASSSEESLAASADSDSASLLGRLAFLNLRSSSLVEGVAAMLTAVGIVVVRERYRN
mmetsp:Transcript_8221/g.19108  ORF Transcript_8221/g.19108 Transcript_8221/m.19108 type:complete len:256 (+) Transcript_8221:927-1694(+)